MKTHPNQHRAFLLISVHIPILCHQPVSRRLLISAIAASSPRRRCKVAVKIESATPLHSLPPLIHAKRNREEIRRPEEIHHRARARLRTLNPQPRRLQQARPSSIDAANLAATLDLIRRRCALICSRRNLAQTSSSSSACQTTPSPAQSNPVASSAAHH
ncbi:hypothetical protein M0R45_027324 [Rubus argutus]|uniref:Uncharacterized protein n=1 Tax=Rubus argutus TaxID=59490 RepID=A0AAW1X2U2_RUBAR